jgi:TonB-linked SusC/RagA family outer membrane protein
VKKSRLSFAAWCAVLTMTLGHARAAGAQAPSGSITGTVIDATTRRPLAGVRIGLTADSARNVTTREDGRFVLTRVPTGQRRVVARLLGYAALEQTVNVSADAPSTLDFALQPRLTTLSDIVVVGYGTQTRSDLTGSVSSVASQELQQTTVTTLEQGLQGRVAGVQVTQGDAAPGGGMRVQIRGTNSMNPGSAQPLYVIDGVPVGNSDVSKRRLGAVSEENLSSLTETNPLATLSPEDIESIDILKDASATAIYGSRGANGVVLITTKSGRRGSRGEYTLNFSQGYASVVDEIPVLNAYDYATYVNTAYINAFGPQTSVPFGGRPGSLTPDSIRKVMGAGTNWQDLIFRTAPIRDGTLGFSGGDDQGSYSISANLLDQGGVISGSQFRRGGLRVNLDRNVSTNFRLSSNLAITRSINDMVRSSTINGYRSIGIVRQAITYVPMSSVDSSRLANDPRAEDPSVWQNFGASPLRYTDEVNEDDQVTRGIGGIRGIAQLGRGFALDLNVGTNYERRTYGAYFPRTVNEGRTANGTAVASGSEYGNLLSENLLRFNRDVGPSHHFDVIGGFTFQSDKSTWVSQEVQGFADDILGGNVLQNGTDPQKPQSGLGTSTLASWLGRVNYSLFDRYLLTATVRADGSSKFASNNKWATFPAFAFAWKMIDEPMLKNQRLFSDLKLRVSYGKSGNQAIGSYQSLPAIAGQVMTLNEAVVPAYVVTQLGNPNLRWETTSQLDIGLDFGVLNNRLTATVDVYRKNTRDLLQQITLAGNTGFSNAWINSGNVTNRGVELQAGYDILASSNKGGLTWHISGNASHNKNRIESLGPVEQQFAARLGAGGGLEATPFIQKPGLPIGAMWGYTTIGLVRTPADSAAYAPILGSAPRVGDVRYLDRNGDGKLNTQDQGVIGDANPTWIWGLSNRLTFRNFDLSALVTAVRGNEIINAERIRYLILDGTINVPRHIVANSFDPTSNPNGKYPMIRQDRKSDARFSDLYIENGSYVRLKNVQLGYVVSLPGARSARFYVNGINLATWTKYSGYDPEVSAFGSPDRPGVDLGSYPQSRIFAFGVNTSF